jgi:murein DD-endopeptidase MepM/ murein hydrolase activator NlpD
MLSKFTTHQPGRRSCKPWSSNRKPKDRKIMATWIRPVEGKITDSFDGHRGRTNPPSRNPGTDYGVAYGTVVKAPADGTVTGVVPTFRGSGGRMIFMSFPGGFNADFLHLSAIDVIAGQEVKQGQRIGLSGASGLQAPKEVTALTCTYHSARVDLQPWQKATWTSRRCLPKLQLKSQ